MKDYVKCINCGKIIREIDEVEFTQFGEPKELCIECKYKKEEEQ